jgi:hypothetical protein
LAGFDPDQVARAARLDPAFTERTPQTVRVNVQGSNRGRRRGLGPKEGDEPIPRDDLVAVQQKCGEKRPLLRSAERNPPAVLEDFDRTEDPKFRRSGPLKSPVTLILSAEADSPG